MIVAALAVGCTSVPALERAAAPPRPAEAAPPQTCAELVAAEEPLEEGSLVAVRAGARLDDPDAAAWGEGWLREGEIVRTGVADRQIQLVPLTWPGNGAALALLRDSPRGLCVINVWAFGFGGNGIDLTSIEVAPSSPTEALIRLELVGHHRGYYEVPGDEATYVEPADDPMRRLLGTDGRRAWMADDPAPDARR